MYEPVVLADPASCPKKALQEPVMVLAPAPVPKRLLLFDSKYSGWTGNAPASALLPAPAAARRIDTHPALA
jgi:hypothetical protein